MQNAVKLVSNVRINLLSCFGAVALLAVGGSAVAATNIYVSPTGSDSNPGTQAAPVKTITRADALASAGSTVHVAAGTYYVSAPSLSSAGIVTRKSGTSSARIRFVSDVKWGAKIVVSGTGITWDSRGNYVDIFTTRVLDSRTLPGSFCIQQGVGLGEA